MCCKCGVKMPLWIATVWCANVNVWCEMCIELLNTSFRILFHNLQLPYTVGITSFAKHCSGHISQNSFHCLARNISFLHSIYVWCCCCDVFAIIVVGLDICSVFVPKYSGSEPVRFRQDSQSSQNPNTQDTLNDLEVTIEPTLPTVMPRNNQLQPDSGNFQVFQVSK